MLLKFVDASPAQTQTEKEFTRAEASSHAARASHLKRRRAEDAKARPLIYRKPVTPGAKPIRKADALPRVSGAQEWLSSPYARSDDLTLTESEWGEVCACRATSFHHYGHHSCSELDDYCEDFGSCMCFAVMSSFPTTRPGWTQEDVVDLQFYMEVFGSNVRNLSNNEFFNSVVPCLVESDVGVRNLLMAVASTYRGIESSVAAYQPVAGIRALEKCNKGIKSLSKDLAAASPEVALTSFVLLITWYMFRSDAKGAAVCTRAAEKICGMNEKTRLKSRLLSARSATDPRLDSNPQKSTFSKVLVGMVAKLGLELLGNLQDPTLPLDPTSFRLDFSSEGLHFGIRDMHDLLSSIELLSPIFQRLRVNLSYHAQLDYKSSLVQDLLVRLDQIAKRLRQVPYQPGRISTAIEIIWQWHRYYSIGIRCQLLSSSEMSWDQHLNDFWMLTEWSERHLSQMQEETSYVFIPVTIILEPLWFTAVHCRDPNTRSRAIAVLLKYHRNEAGLDSWFAGHIAQELMYLEQEDKKVDCATGIRDSDRLLLRGFEFEGDSLYLLYVHATDVGTPAENAIFRHRFTIPRDPHGIVRMWEQSDNKISRLQVLASTIGQLDTLSAPLGFSLPIYYDEKFVEVVLPEYGY